MGATAQDVRKRPWLVALALALAVGCLYGRAASFPYVEFDDPGYVRDNPHLAHGLSGESVRWALTSTTYQYNWHPLTWLSHGLDVELFGPAPGPRHLGNVLLHALTAALLFLAFRALTGRTWPSAFTAALFALHPLRVESVAWIAQRKDVLAGAFFAATLLLYARHARAPSLAGLAGLALACAAGLAAKPTLVTLPFVLLLLDLWPLGRVGRAPLARLVLEKAPLFALATAAAAVTFLAQDRSGALKTPALSVRLANAAESVLAYARAFVWPADLAVFHPHPDLVGTAPPGWIVPVVAALLALALGAAWRMRRSASYLFTGLAWFLGMLVPMLGLVQVGLQARADRYAYLPLIGLEFALAFGAAALVERWPRARGAVVAAALASLAGLAWVSTLQLAHWRDSEALFRHALAVTERNFVIENNLGNVLAREGRLDEAILHFQAAAAIRPGFFEAEWNAGLALERRGALALAREALERAVAARPSSAQARLALARVLLGLGRTSEADAELARALECDPRLVDDADARRLGEEILQRTEAR